MDITFTEALYDEDLSALSATAEEIWREYYPGIISAAQVEYMIDLFLSSSSLAKQVSEGYRFFFVRNSACVLGYIGVKPREDELFLSKLYLKREFRGRGVFSQMLAFCERLAEESHLSGLSLTVNRNNTQAIAVYLRKGFVTVREQKAAIGQGYYMDDYVMRKIPLTPGRLML